MRIIISCQMKPPLSYKNEERNSFPISSVIESQLLKILINNYSVPSGRVADALLGRCRPRGRGEDGYRGILHILVLLFRQFRQFIVALSSYFRNFLNYHVVSIEKAIRLIHFYIYQYFVESYNLKN